MTRTTRSNSKPPIASTPPPFLVGRPGVDAMPDLVRLTSAGRQVGERLRAMPGVVALGGQKHVITQWFRQKEWTLHLG